MLVLYKSKDMTGSIENVMLGDKLGKFDKSAKFDKSDKFECVVPAWSDSDYKSGVLLLLARYGRDTIT